MTAQSRSNGAPSSSNSTNSNDSTKQITNNHAKDLRKEMAMPILEAIDITKDYDSRVLHGLNVTIEAGSFVAIMGPSGSGKTTFLHILSGLDRPTGGTVKADGEELTGMKEKDLAALRLRRLGFVFQNPHLLRTLCLLDNIALPGFLAGDKPREEIVARARGLMASMGISELESSDVAEVSGGQLQRASICRALINDPEIVIGDEPTGALNSASAAQVLDIMGEIRARGTTVVLVTHDPMVAVRADRVLVLVDGKITDDVALGRYSPDAAAERTARVTSLLASRGVCEGWRKAFANCSSWRRWL